MYMHKLEYGCNVYMGIICKYKCDTSTLCFMYMTTHSFHCSYTYPETLTNALYH